MDSFCENSYASEVTISYREATDLTIVSVSAKKQTLSEALVVDLLFGGVQPMRSGKKLQTHVTPLRYLKGETRT